MKRVRIAVALLAVVIAFSIGALWIQNRATERLIDTCNELIAVYQSGDIEGCRKKARELSETMDKDMRWFPFFLGHDRMESIFSSNFLPPLQFLI